MERSLESVGLYDQVEAKYIHNFLALLELARVELASGHREAAEVSARLAIALAESMAGKESPSYLIGLSQAALGEVQLPRHDAAAHETFASAQAQLDQTLGKDHRTPSRPDASPRTLLTDAAARPCRIRPPSWKRSASSSSCR